MVWGPAWLSRAPVALPSSRLLRLLRLRLLSMEVMLEEEVVRERARRVIPADGTETQKHALIFQSHITRAQRGEGVRRRLIHNTEKVLTMQTILKYGDYQIKDTCDDERIKQLMHLQSN